MSNYKGKGTKETKKRETVLILLTLTYSCSFGCQCILLLCNPHQVPVHTGPVQPVSGASAYRSCATCKQFENRSLFCFVLVFFSPKVNKDVLYP